MNILISRIRVRLPAWSWGGSQKALSCKNIACYVLGWFFGILRVNPALLSVQSTGCTILSAFAKLRKPTVSFIMCVLSVRPHGTAQLPLEGFLWNFIFGYFFENLSRKFKFFKNVTSITGTLHEDLCTFIICRWILCRMRNVSDKSCRDNQNTHFMFSNLFPTIYEIIWKNMVQPDRPQMTIHV
jgi:hypothetical protein